MMSYMNLTPEQIDLMIATLRRLAVADEIAGMGDVEDPEGRARIEMARGTLAGVGLSHKSTVAIG